MQMFPMSAHALSSVCFLGLRQLVMYGRSQVISQCPFSKLSFFEKLDPWVGAIQIFLRCLGRAFSFFERLLFPNASIAVAFAFVMSCQSSIQLHFLVICQVDSHIQRLRDGFRYWRSPHVHPIINFYLRNFRMNFLGILLLRTWGSLALFQSVVVLQGRHPPYPRCQGPFRIHFFLSNFPLGSRSNVFK